MAPGSLSIIDNFPISATGMCIQEKQQYILYLKIQVIKCSTKSISRFPLVFLTLGNKKQTCLRYIQ